MQTYRSKMRLAGGLAFAAAVGAGVVAGRVVRMGEPGENFWIVFPALLVICAAAFAACIPWWRRADDMQKSAQMVSWFWGGSIGTAIALMAILAATGVRSAMSLGGLYLLLGQTGGFLLFWLGWRLQHRGGEG